MRIEKYYYSDTDSQTPTVQNTDKFQLFHQLSSHCESLAQEIGANLLVDTDDHAGWITLICDAFSFKDSVKHTILQLAEQADEITIQSSVDTGEHSPADIDNAIQVTFWFDLVSYIPCD